MSKPKNPGLFYNVAAWLNQPLQGFDEELHLSTDVALRDLFAAFALAGMLSNSRQSPREANEHKAGIAEPAYHFADAMLAEREKTG